MAYLGNKPATGENNAFRILDDISSHVVSFNGSSASVVSVSADTITIAGSEHRYITGQRVTYSKGGGTVITGLTDATAYYVIRDSATTIKLATTASNANNGVAVNLTGLGAGTAHTLTLAFDGTNTKFKPTYNDGSQNPIITRAAQLVISLNGVIQQPIDSASPSAGFGIDVSGNIIFSTAPDANDDFWGHVHASNTVTFDISDNDIDNFTGDGSTANFNLSKIPPNNENILVTLDGVVQYPSDNSNTRAYTLSENELQMVSAPGNGVAIQVRHIGFAGPSSGGSGGVTGFYGRTGNVVLKSTDNPVIGNLTAVDGTFSGNVSIAKTLTYMDVAHIDAVGVITAQNDVNFNGSGAGISSSYWDSSANEFKFKDNVKLSFGDGRDLQLSHNGSDSVISQSAAGTGALKILSGGAQSIECIKAGAVNIAHNGTTRLETTGTGVNITDNLNVAGITTLSDDVNFQTANGNNIFIDKSDNSIKLGNSVTQYFGGTSMWLMHNGSTGYLNNGTGDLYIRDNDGDIYIQGKAGENSIICNNDGQVDLFYDNTKRLSTSGIGATVFGQLDIESAGSYIKSNQLKFNPSGHSYIDHGVTSQDIIFRVSNSSALDFTAMTIDSGAQQTKFGKQIVVGSQGGNDVTTIGGGSGIGAYIQLDHASSGTNSKLMGNNDSWLNANHGNLGIGTANPQSRKLHVLGTGRPVEIGSTNATNISKFYTSTTGRSTYNGLDIIVNTTNGSSFAAYGGYLDFGTSASNGSDVTSRLRITAQGRVNIGEANLTQTATSLSVTRNAGGTVAGESVIAATMGDNTTMVNAMLTVRNAGNRGNRGNGAGSKLASFEFNDKNALTIDKSGLVQIGGDSGVGGTWHHEVYNDSGTCSSGVFGTTGAWFQLQDTVSGENFVMAANGDCNLYSYKNDDSICFNTTTGGTTTQMLKLLGDGNMRWFPDGSNGVNLHMTSGTSSVVFAANKNGSTGTTWHFKNQNSSGQARTWMEVSDAQCVAMPYAMGGTNILNLYNTTGRDGLNIFANVSSGNQNSDAGAITFNGYAQTNGAWIQGTNELSWAKKDLLLGTSYGTGNNYDTRDWDKPVQRLTYGGWIGMKEAATTNAAVKSLLHIKGTSDNGSADATLTIEDSDDTAGSKEPILAFDGNGTRQGRIMSTDTNGMYFSTGSSNNTVIQLTDKRDLYVHANSRAWATMQLGNIRYHCRQHHAPGNAVTTTSLMRVKRYWWGWGTYKITAKLHYYGSHSGESTFFLNGHGNNDSYSIKRLDQSLTNGGDNHYGSSNLISITSPSNSSPGNSTTSFVDVQINIPNYTYAIIVMECMSSQYTTDPTNIGNDGYCLL